MPRSFFDSLNGFIRRHYRAVISAWVVAVLISLVLIPSFFSSVSYDLTGAFGLPSNTEAERASSIIQAQFPATSNSSGNAILVVIQGVPVYSDALKQGVLGLNTTLTNDGDIANYTGMSSLYSLEAGLLNSSLPDIVVQAGDLQSNITFINSGLYTLQQNLSTLSANLFQLLGGINQTAQLIYGAPATFVSIWGDVTAQGVTDPYLANTQANATIFNITSDFGGNAQSIAYYLEFFNVWNATFQALPNSTAVSDREAYAVNQSVSAFLSNPQLNPQMAQLVSLVASGLNVTTWDQAGALTGLAISSVASGIPPELSSSLGASPESLVNELYSFGPSPSNATLGNYTVALFENDYANMSSSSSGLPITALIQSSYMLGPSPSGAQAWSLASSIVANATQSSFDGSPLFSVNGTSLGSLLSSLMPNATTAQINSAITNVISNSSYADYPYAPSSALTGNFVNHGNDTMLIILGFSTYPTSGAIARVQSDVQNSQLQGLGKVYVTGGPVLTNDVQNAFLPALTLTAGPGIAVSLLIVGLLFLAPLAALIPVLLGGISISVALASIYLGIVKIGHGSLTFLTPTLTILLMLGLAVDYSVLQLRRTREERQQGKSTEESVHISIKWAGQAILTAGITVIVAYVVMAAANVPLFSDVGTAIALGVSILLVASLTLLPALEMALGDRIFWPSLNRHKNASQGKSRLKRLSEGTLRRKVPIVIAIGAIALGAFFIAYSTPTSSDFLKLIPNFPSNQGLTAVESSFGTGTMEPTYIVITTSTPITYGDNQFNQTLLNQIDQITAAAANSSGVTVVSSPTRPFGSVADYSSFGNLSGSTGTQYAGQIFSTIGRNNETAVITLGLSGPASSGSTINYLRGMEDSVGKVSLPSGVAIYYGGETQSTLDDQLFMSNLLPEVVIILAAAIYVILFFQLRSAFTPIRLIVTILCSVVFSLAILSLVFYTWLGLPVLDFAPLFVVVTMLGVGIDYDIFFVTRIREEVLNGKTDNEAIKTAIQKVWVTILGLGLVLSVVFASLIITGIAVLQEVALTVAAAVFIDVSIVILFFVPSLMGLAQRFNWWPYKLSWRRQPGNDKERNTSTEKD